MLRTGKAALQFSDPHHNAPSVEGLAASLGPRAIVLDQPRTTRPRVAIIQLADPISSTESAFNNSYEELGRPRGTTLTLEAGENPRSGTWTVPGVVSILRRLERWERAGVEPVAA